MKLSPTLFLVLEFFILLPSLIFIIGVLLFLLFRNSFLLFSVTPNGAIMQNILITIILPSIGGIFAYQYLERFKPKDSVMRIAKAIIFFSIMFVGLVLLYTFLNNILQ